MVATRKRVAAMLGKSADQGCIAEAFAPWTPPTKRRAIEAHTAPPSPEFLAAATPSRISLSSCPSPAPSHSSVAGPAAPPPRSGIDWFDATDECKVRAVSAALHWSNVPKRQLPVCRDQQLAPLQESIQKALDTGRGSSVYVAGLPGTGKTLTVRAAVLETVEAHERAGGARPALLAINCMKLDSAAAIYPRLLAGMRHCASRSRAEAEREPLHQASGAACGKAGAADVRAFLTAGAPTKGRGKGRKQPGLTIAVLDEMDQLLGRDAEQQVLTELFSLPGRPGCRLLLLGIANSVDLTERRLPQLAAKGCKPQVVLFPTYSRLQIAEVISSRLEHLPFPAFDPAAVRLCAEKVANSSGDMRRALSACLAALDRYVADYTPEAAAEDEEERLVGILQMKQVLDAKTGGGTNAMAARIRQLPEQQQLALIAAHHVLGDGRTQCASAAPGSPSVFSAVAAAPSRRLSLSRPASSGGSAVSGGSGRRSSLGGQPRRECTIAALHNCYQGLCRQMDFPLEGFGGFKSLVSLMDGVLTLRPAREPSKAAVSLAVAYEDIERAVSCKPLFRTLLQGGK